MLVAREALVASTISLALLLTGWTGWIVEQTIVIIIYSHQIAAYFEILVSSFLLILTHLIEEIRVT